ncbi:hypothetical protein HYU23_01760 [Candidatus Woesearchaeota archaeon]|nr:hypothetical protein [Candidatus Woesearchaeota archaeon]
MIKKMLLFLIVFSFILISGCVPEKNIQIDDTTASISKDQKVLPQNTEKLQLGTLCSGQEECVSFCHNNKGRCTQYCKEHSDNNLCGIVFPFKTNTSSSSLCKGTKVMFDNAPVNLEKTELFLPLGLMSGGHVTPVDHHYFQNFANQEADIEVYSPGYGVITEIQHMPGAPDKKDYRVVIQHTCTISSIFIHIEILSDKLASQASENFAGTNIQVKAGEVIGWYKTNVDYNIVDNEVTLSGFVIPEHYQEQDPWKIHVPNTYEYFNEPIKSELLAKSVRTIEPRAGKIDYDIDGKLVGNWFEEESNGYAGKGGKEYWQSHLSFTYDFLDPSLIIVSMADYGGIPNQFAIKGNTPDPAKISKDDGIINYELVSWGYTTEKGEEWNKVKLAKIIKATGGTHVAGTVVVQMLEDRKIKFETFPGKTSSQVIGFTDNAKIYER